MPRVSFFYGITILMYWNEGKHKRPHFHAEYGEYEAVFDFDGHVMVGSLPSRASKLVGEWARLHAAELMANWVRARRNEPVKAIAPLQ
jgi:hypothetical protein